MMLPRQQLWWRSPRRARCLLLTARSARILPSPRATATTLAPMTFPSCTAASPTPPAAPRTSRVWPAPPGSRGLGEAERHVQHSAAQLAGVCTAVRSRQCQHSCDTAGSSHALHGWRWKGGRMALRTAAHWLISPSSQQPVHVPQQPPAHTDQGAPAVPASSVSAKATPLCHVSTKHSITPAHTRPPACPPTRAQVGTLSQRQPGGAIGHWQASRGLQVDMVRQLHHGILTHDHL